jgi:hypothetical protein
MTRKVFVMRLLMVCSSILVVVTLNAAAGTASWVWVLGFPKSPKKDTLKQFKK